MPAGAPTKYDPEFCERVIEWGKMGKSRAWMASRLDVAIQTIYNWEALHPEFLEAMARAAAHAQAHWEDQGHDNLTNREFQSAVWTRSMGARFPKDWREKHAHVGGDEGDSPIKQEVSVGADAFTRAIAGLVARQGAGSADRDSDA